jgi:drug/metabolite transporter (DMT)-like permease
MTMMRIDWRVPAAFAAIYILWGSTYLAIALALPSIPPLLLMASRSLAGGLILFAYARWQGTAMPASWLIAGVCGLLFFVGCHGVLALAQQRVPSGVAGIILATIPFWIALIGLVWPAGKSPRLLSLGLLAPGLAGVALIAWGQITSGDSGVRLPDILLLLAASFSWALGSVLSERRAPAETSAIALSAMALIVGGAALLGISSAAGEFSRFAFGRLSAASVLAWIYLTLAGTVVAFAAYVWLLERVAPTFVATYTFVNPVIAVMLGWAILGEPLGPMMLIGGTLVVGSIISLLVFDPPSTSRTPRPALKGPVKSSEAGRVRPAGPRVSVHQP